MDMLKNIKSGGGRLTAVFKAISSKCKISLIKLYCLLRYPKKIRRLIIYKLKEEILNNNFCKIKFVLKDGRIIERDYVNGLNLQFSGKSNINNEIIFYCENENDIYKKFFINLNIYIAGTNSKLHIEFPTRIENSTFILYSNSFISIKKTPYYIVDTTIKCGHNKLEIGENFSTHRCFIFICEEKNINMKIGDNCMFSFDIAIWPTDGHKIYDVESKQVLNKARCCISIGNHVWLGNGVKVLKNSFIPDNCAVGAGSIVVGNFTTPNVLLAGVPAKVIKSSINWSNEAPDA